MVFEGREYCTAAKARALFGGCLRVQCDRRRNNSEEGFFVRRKSSQMVSFYTECSVVDTKTSTVSME